MYHLMVILFFALINNNDLNGMKPQKPQKKRRSDGILFDQKSFSADEATIKRRSCNFQTDPTVKKANSDETKRANKSKLPTINEAPYVEHGFLTAVRKNNIDKVKFYLQNPHLFLSDIKDQWGNTALHLAALNHHFEIIDMLLHNPRTNACLQNEDGSFPQTLLQANTGQSTLEMQQKISQYAQIFFAHATLNTNVTKCASKIYPFYLSGDIDQAVLNGIVKTIKRKINDDKKKQDAQLPTQAQLPDYATDQFIMNMLLCELAFLSNQKN